MSLVTRPPHNTVPGSDGFSVLSIDVLRVRVYHSLTLCFRLCAIKPDADMLYDRAGLSNLSIFSDRQASSFGDHVKSCHSFDPKPAYTSATIFLHFAYLVVASPLLQNALQSTSVAPVFNVLGPTTFGNGIHNPFSGPPSETTLRWLDSFTSG